MESKIYKSETIDHTYLEIEIVDGHGVLYEIYCRGDVFDTSYICDVYANVPISATLDGPCYDADLDWFQLEFLQSIFPNIKRI